MIMGQMQANLHTVLEPTRVPATGSLSITRIINIPSFTLYINRLSNKLYEKIYVYP